MTFQVAPSVLVQEIDLTSIVPSIATTEAGFAGHFSWGPVDKRILISNEEALVANFQEPGANTATDFFVAANFLSYGNQLWTVRTVASVGASVAARNAHGNVANTGSDLVIKNDDDYAENFSNGVAGVGSFAAKYPGELGNSIKVSVCPSAEAWASNLTGTLSITTNTNTVSGSGTDFTNEVTVGDILVLGPDRNQHQVAAIANTTSLTLSTTYTGNTVAASAAVERRWEYFNQFNIAPGTSVYAQTRGGTDDEIHIAVVDEDGEWTGSRGTVLETFENVSLASDAQTEDGSNNYYKNVINNQSLYVWWTAHESTNTNAGNKASATFGGDTTPDNVSMVNGLDGDLPSSADKINSYNLFRSPEEVDVSFIMGSDANQAVALHLIDNIAEVRKDCIVCLSPERADVVNNSAFDGAETEDAVAFRNSLSNSSYAVMDSGWKYQYDRYNDLFRYVPLNGDKAGLMVRTDSTRDPWYSPAGYIRGRIKNVVRLSFNPNSAERNQLFKNDINPVVSEAGQGTVLLGDKTMIGRASAFDAINVRRLFIVLEKSIATASRQTLFEFNDEFTRAQFKNLVEPFLRDVQGRRGITDFRVVVDETNNTAEVIDRNEFVGDIFIKPARAIRFIRLRFVATRTGVDFDEIVGNFG